MWQIDEFDRPLDHPPARITLIVSHGKAIEQEHSA
jgi:hypothetical protein